jgi:HPt (histidine-containing phosphotransfer) domain-containing protein
MANADHPVLDPETLANLEQLASETGNPTFLSQLTDLFGANAPARMAQIRAAIADRQAETLERVAHTLKSNCSMLGAMRMAGFCRQLESMGERQAFEEAAALLPDAVEEFALVAREILALGDRVRKVTP